MSLDQQAPVALPSIAQTNLAFYKQLHAAGYDQAALLHMRDAYECATSLFAGLLRGTSKPFLAHLVGTASILAALDAAPDIVTAGLLHAAYEQGEWGFTRGRNRRQHLRDVIGEAAEALVWRYQELGWTMETIHRLHNGIASLTDIDRAVVLIRLANEWEDHLDLAMRYVHPSKEAYRDVRAVFIAMAEALHQPQLATALTEAYRETDDATWAQALSLGRRGSYRLHSPFLMTMLKAVRALFSGLRG